MKHGTSTFFQRPDRVDERLYVITSVFNSARYRTRWKLYQDFADRVKKAGARLYTVEVAFGPDRKFAVTKPNHRQHLQLRTQSEFWLKEASQNLMLERLPSTARYVAFIDADMAFARDDWADDTLHELQRYPVVQMYSKFQDLNPDGEQMGDSPSFMEVFQKNGQNTQPTGNGHGASGGQPGCPGGAWAYRIETLSAMGRLLDLAILGADDWYMAHALTGQWDKIEWPSFHPGYIEAMSIWAKRAYEVVNGNVGVVKGLALHYWHGPKMFRRYGKREGILVKYQYNPAKDLVKDWQGLYFLDPKRAEMIREIARYIGQRNEDSIDVYVPGRQ